MPRSPLLLLALLPFLAPGSVQASDPIVVRGQAQALAPEMTDAVVSRVMSFDRDRDGTVATHELVERMQHLVARGDADGDGALDQDEVRALTRMPFARPTARALLTGGSYGFADDITFSSRSHVEGAIVDLRLPAGIREQALAIATTVVNRHEAAARATLLDDMKDVLTAAQFLAFQRALDSSLQAMTPSGGLEPFPQPMPFTGGPVHAVLRGAPSGEIVETMRSTISIDGIVRTVTITRQIDLSRHLMSQSLEPEQRAKAEAAVQRFKERARLDDAGRAALLAELRDLLDAEAHDNLRAALERRPVVARGGRAFVFSGANVSRPVQFGIVPLIHRMPED